MRVRRWGGQGSPSRWAKDLWPLGQRFGEMLKPRWGRPLLTQTAKCPCSNLVLAMTGFAFAQFLKPLTSLHNICPIEKPVLHETSHGLKQTSMMVFAYHWGFTPPLCANKSEVAFRWRDLKDITVASKTENLWTMWKVPTRISQWQRRPGKTKSRRQG